MTVEQGMNPAFKKTLWISTLAHFLLLALILGWTSWSGEKKPAPQIQWLEIPNISTPTPSPTPHAPLPAPPTPLPPAEPAPQSSPPPSPDPTPETPPKPQPKPTPKNPRTSIKTAPDKPKETVKPAKKDPVKKNPAAKKTPSQPVVKISTNTVTRSSAVQTTKPKPSAPSFDESAFSKKLLSRLSDGMVTVKGAPPSGGSSSAKPSPYTWYLSHIFNEMYAAWTPPLGIPEGITTQVLIRVQKDGSITKVSLAQSSGNKPMDDSAMTAAGRVKRLQPLPSGLGGEFAEITIHFKLQK